MNVSRKTVATVLMGLLFALSVTLSYLESSISAFIPVPGIKLGLSNIVVMYCMFVLGAPQAYTMAALKSFFVFLTRGGIAAGLSLCGGLASVTVMLILRHFTRRNAGAAFTSAVGGVAHNAGQVLLAVALVGRGVVYYFPILAISGILTGIATGVIYRFTLPYLLKHGY